MAAMDECYLQGADRVWANAEPGAIVHAVQRAGSAQLLLVLDEMDKSGGSSWRGSSPTAWLLELLGSTTWSDRYVGVPYPTSAMSFVAALCVKRVDIFRADCGSRPPAAAGGPSRRPAGSRGSLGRG